MQQYAEQYVAQYMAQYVLQYVEQYMQQYVQQYLGQYADHDPESRYVYAPVLCRHHTGCAHVCVHVQKSCQQAVPVAMPALSCIGLDHFTWLFRRAVHRSILDVQSGLSE